MMNPEGYIQSRLPFIIILALELNAGMVMNAFIIFVVYRDFTKTKTVSNSFKILVCLAASCVCYGVLMSVGLLDHFCSLGIFTTIDATYVSIYLLLCTISSCAWLVASLGFFYFIKISNFKSGCISLEKKNISSIVLRMVLVNVLLSLLNSVLSSLFFIFSQASPHNSTNSSPALISTLSQSSTAFANAIIINTILPFLMVFVTTLFTVVTLKKHSHRMKNVQTSDSEHLRSYEKVVCRMTQSLLFYGTFYIVTIVFYFVVITQKEFGFWLWLLVLSAFSPVQTVLLVLANPRLKAVWKEIFRCVRLQETVIT